MMIIRKHLKQDNLLELLEYSQERFENTKLDTNAIRNIQDDEDVEKLNIELLKQERS